MDHNQPLQIHFRFLVPILLVSIPFGLLISNDPTLRPVMVPVFSLSLLNILCIALPAFAISYIAARAYRANGSASLLFLGAGFLVSGIGSLLSAGMLSLTGSPNLLVTIHNSGMLLSSFCFLSSSWLLISRYRAAVDQKRHLLPILYGGTTFFLMVLTLLAANGLTPLFFIQGQGPSALRQLVLVVATVFYSQTILLLLIKYARTRTAFLLWYALSLFLITAGLLLILLQHNIGSLTNLLGRSAQYLGHLYALVAVFVGIKEAKHRQVPASEALAEFFWDAEENYQTLVETIELAVVSVDVHDRILLWNASAEQLFGLNREEVLAKTLGETGAFDDESVWQTVTGQGQVVYKEFISRIKTSDNRWLPVEVSLSARPSPSGSIRTYIIKDITEELRYENEMARLSGLDMVGEMASAMGHEVRNPMTTVRGMLQMLGRKDASMKEKYDLMIGEIDRANAIITEYLSLAKNKTAELVPRDLSDILTNMQQLMEALALEQGKRIEIATARAGTPVILLDEKEIRQLIINLVKNAIDASVLGGTVAICLEDDREQLVLSVSDNGPGIPPEIMAKLGTPFLTTKPDGNGLGLPVCYRIAARHGASIAVHSDAGGTTFRVEFPLKPVP
ncbi:MAG: ATP-binding protein [Negativicutes bacterium]|nr:ATP-binding protein [Negativicutes bacterium]